MKSTFSQGYDETKPEYIDIHSHLYPDYYTDDLSAVLKRMRENKVATINVGTGLETSKKALEVAEQNENIFSVIGFHPMDVAEIDENVFEEFEELLKHPKCVGIGEVGLDFAENREQISGDKQKIFFKKQIELSIKYDKPLMIHCRDAWDDTLEILKQYKKENPNLKVNFHFFNQDIDRAKQILDLGFQFSFTGIITFVKELEEVVKFAPLDKIMSETDAPYVSPVPFRRQKNEPTFVIEVVKKIAELKNLDLEIVKKQLLKNAEDFWGLILMNEV